MIVELIEFCYAQRFCDYVTLKSDLFSSLGHYFGSSCFALGFHVTHVRRLYKLGFITLTLWRLHVWKWILISRFKTNVGKFADYMFCFPGFYRVGFPSTTWYASCLLKILIDLHRFGEFEFI